jgi:hypothetical protein
MGKFPPVSARTPLVECHCLKIGTMTKSGAIVRGQLSRGSLKFGADTEAPLLIEFVADLRDPNAMVLELRPLQAEPYQIRLADMPIDPGRGGRRLAFICPARGVRTLALYCPPGSTQFLSSRAHNLLVESDRVSHEARPLRKLQAARQRWERASAPKPPARGKRGATPATLARLRADLAEAELSAWSQALAASTKRKK